ncbi:MAG: hypothetical protein HY327_07845 [Chloroflexi bacterium]|nr:hypothetical protein [Chloroflexota bacterium]
MSIKLLCLTFAIALTACSPAPASTPTPAATPTAAPFAISGDKYLFIEYTRVVDGTGRLLGLAVDFPGYQFDAASGELKLAAAPVVKLGGGQIGLFGLSLSRTGAAGTGTGSTLTPIDALPLRTLVPVFGDYVNSAEKFDDVPLVVKSVAADGSVLVDLGTESRALKAGEKWERVIEKDVTSPRGAGHLRITHTLANYGLLDRAKIIQQTK